MLITFIGIQAFGYTLNILTLGALTIAIGRVVDDSIVVIENIKRHYVGDADKLRAILLSVREVAAAITASTITTVAVFLPLAFVSDVTELNVKDAIQTIRLKSPVLKDLESQGKIKIVGAIYDTNNGKITWQ